ncbi:putative S-adenosyl-L-methionine-dependent methyltransferase [Helianthus anomalus]
MIVLEHRETDWNFCTESGHLQLLYEFSNISRLILIGNNLDPNLEPLDYVRTVVDPVDMEKIECELEQLVIALHPKICFRNSVPKTLFLTYEDDVLQRVVIKRFVGPFVGEFIVEDVQLGNKEFRRRLRFKRMPNLIQSQVPVVVNVCNVELGLVSLGKMKKVEFWVDTWTLVQTYLTPMVSGLFLIVSSVNDRIRQGFSPRVLCLGVGGGALLSFLNGKLGFEVVGVEGDEVVLSVARGYFGLTDGKSVELIVVDAIQLIGGLYDKFDVVMIDLDSTEASSGISGTTNIFFWITCIS